MMRLLKNFWFWLVLGILGYLLLPASWASTGGIILGVGYILASNAPKSN